LLGPLSPRPTLINFNRLSIDNRLISAIINRLVIEPIGAHTGVCEFAFSGLIDLVGAATVLVGLAKVQRKLGRTQFYIE
jgi:hypothetical protein